MYDNHRSMNYRMRYAYHLYLYVIRDAECAVDIMGDQLVWKPYLLVLKKHLQDLDGVGSPMYRAIECLCKKRRSAHMVKMRMAYDYCLDFGYPVLHLGKIRHSLNPCQGLGREIDSIFILGIMHIILHMQAHIKDYDLIINLHSSAIPANFPIAANRHYLYHNIWLPRMFKKLFEISIADRIHRHCPC